MPEKRNGVRKPGANARQMEEVQMPEKGYVPGLKGVVAAQTLLSRIDGDAGELIVGGFPLESLAHNASYEEMLHLLWNDRLPDARQLNEVTEALAIARPLPEATISLLRAAAAGGAPVIDALRMGVSTLSLGCPASLDERTGALTVVARFPTLVAAYWRLLNGSEPIAPRGDLGHAANYLYMLTGEESGPSRNRAIETYLNTVTDHGMNASTFTARVIVSTRSDMTSAVTGALGALKGPLHGGAPGPALDMVFEIGTRDNVEPYLRAKLERGERLMGFGHAVYNVRDPRADVLAAEAARFFRSEGDRELYDLAREVERAAVRLLAEYKPGRNLETNVEYYTALLLHGLGLPSALFTPTFAVGRVGGWTAHGLEQKAQDRIIRPRAEYVGATGRRWEPVSER